MKKALRLESFAELVSTVPARKVPDVGHLVDFLTGLKLIRLRE
jgi:hypothetical protein